jgi:hypothetical protein
MLDTLLQASPPLLVVLCLCLWKLPEWARKWIGVARDLRAYRSGR